MINKLMCEEKEYIKKQPSFNVAINKVIDAIE